MTKHSAAPYYDQFNAGNNYLKLLFVGGKTLQSSELNQLQSTLQNQISVHGKHVFQNGAVVTGGEQSLDTDIKTLKLTSSSDTSVFVVGDTIKGGTSNTLAKIVHIDVGVSNPYLFVVPTGAKDDFDSGENLEIYSYASATGVSTSNDLEVTDFSSTGTVFSIAEGFLFYDGFFVNFPKQSIVVKQDDNDTSSKIVGMVASEEIVTYLDDPSLNDPAGGLENFGQDGAHRFKTTMSLVTREETDVLGDDFVEIARVENDSFVNDQRVEVYSDFEDTLARRTYDESGNYTVRPFKISLDDSAKVNDLTTESYFKDADNLAFVKTSSNKIDINVRRGLNDVNNFTTRIAIEVSGNTLSNVTKSNGNSTKYDSLIDFETQDPILLGSFVFWADNGILLRHPHNVNANTTVNGVVSLTFNNDLDKNTKIRIKLYDVEESGNDTYFWFGDYLLGKNLSNEKEWTFNVIDKNTDDEYNICLDSGKAYVRGYEFETISKTVITAPRARDTLVVQNFGVGVTYGNYVLTTNLEGWFATDTMETVGLYSATKSVATVGDLIGTAKIRQINRESSTQGRAYLFDIKINSTSNFSELRSIRAGASTGSFDIASDGIVNGSAKLFDTSFNGLVFNINQSNIKTLLPNGTPDITYTTRLKFEGTFNNGSLSLNAGSGRQFLSGNNVRNFLIVSDADDSIIEPDSISFGANPQIITIQKSGLAQSVKILANVRINTAQQANKTYVENAAYTITDGTASFYNSSTRTYTLKKSDGYALKSVIDTNGVNITNRFSFDDGQKDNYYDHCGIVLNSSSSVQSSEYPLEVTFDYFTHSGSGFFSVDSYGEIPYSNIPFFKSPTVGSVYSLKDSIDFRPRREDGSSTVIIEPYVGGALLPANSGSNILNSDYEFYLPRIDKVVLTKERNFELISGISSINPVSPKDSEDAMTLYTLTIPAYTNHPKNIKIKYHENKRYTMRDIGSLEKRIENLEYYTTLSLLEKDTIATSVTDNQGNNRFKNGIIVDSFVGHNVGDVGNADYKCSIDTQNQFLRTPFVSRNMKLDVLSTSGLVTVGNSDIGEFLMLPYTTEKHSDQPYASKIENVNPYLVVKYIGSTTLNPSIDNWVDTQTRPDVVVNLEGNNDAIAFIQQSVNGTDAEGFGTVWNDWETTWTGVETNVTTTTVNDTVTEFIDTWVPNRITGIPALDGTNQFGTVFNGVEWTNGGFNQTINVPRTVTTTTSNDVSNQSRTGTTTTFSPNTITENIGSRVVDVSVIPFMRSRIVRFTASGLRPNRELYAFFDNVNVDEYITPNALTSFQKGLFKDVISLQGNNTGERLVTNEFGEVSGTFEIPSGIFRTGERSFTLIDDPSENKSAATTYSTQKYTASGLVQTREDTIISTRTLEVTQEVITEERTISEPIQVPQPTVVIPNIIPRIFLRSDPLAQTIFVSNQTNPNGIFVSDVDVYFKTKSVSNVPVRMEIRPVSNGYPSSSKIVPMSVVIKNPDTINLSNDGSVATKFTFPVPIYLAGGAEYAIVLLADSQEYEVYVSEMGEIDLISGSRISKQPSLGSLFKSQNGSTWTATQNEDLKFKVNKCLFQTGSTGNVVFNNQDVESDFEYSLLKFVSENVEFSNSATSINWKVATTDLSNVTETEFNPIENNKNTQFNETRKVVSGNDNSLNFKGTIGTSSKHVSPMIDVTRQYAIAVENIVNNTFVDEELSNGGDALAKYITRRVTLEENLDGNYIKVYLTAYKPEVTDIQVYYRVLASEDSTDFDQRPYVLMDQKTDVNTISSGQNDYKELVFVPPTDEITYTDENGSTFDTYKIFAVKVVMTSANTSVVPKIKDLRVISTAP